MEFNYGKLNTKREITIAIVAICVLMLGFTLPKPLLLTCVGFSGVCIALIGLLEVFDHRNYRMTLILSENCLALKFSDIYAEIPYSHIDSIEKSLYGADIVSQGKRIPIAKEMPRFQTFIAELQKKIA